MPELPEAETMARELAQKTLGHKIAEVQVSYPAIVASDLSSFSSLLTGRKVLQVRRLGKRIVFDLAGGHNLLIHLKMTGQFKFCDFWPGSNPESWPPHCHAAFKIKKNSPQKDETLFYQDTRKFGRLRAFGPGEMDEFLAGLNLGPDALSAGPEDYHRLLSASRGQLKAVLLNQSVLAGFGNIYADETLLAAKLSPLRPAMSLTLNEARTLQAEAQRILTQAIECRGSTVSSYTAPQGAGSFQNHHKAYGQAGQPCPFCGEKLLKTRVGGRTTVYCPFCQK
ncbi:MAG: bifunctional DNA-formamidopyrimidine glycosylase/DNA-(apurinic or apyrimidinic site) lyase [Deltaproteobacteria bacterium]|jgi:formamidopyrimidine-DNA glycosylase|nr:bifunctional DNA-formamidopyrimidine glycosylase/DNA-(apurinic or apyrimidinic site) lyase [Deltaproteobacteria bacterium]